MQAQALTGGFEAPAVQAAFAFRAVMDAMARPGTWHDIAGVTPPAPLSAAAGCVLLTLCDGDTPLYLAGDADCEAVRAWVAFHTGAPITDKTDCMFALGSWGALVPMADYRVGTPEYPDRSATLIVDGADEAGVGVTLRGPGIQTQMDFTLPEISAFQANAALFPLGLDFIFASGSRVAALPRSTAVTASDGGF